MSSWTGCTSTSDANAWNRCTNMSFETALGGKNTLIVLDDADLDIAVSNAAWGAYLHQGQICMASGRILVQHDLAQDFVRRLAEKARSLPVGDPAASPVALGPLINRCQVDHAQ